jgi:arylsulfatase A-like enzyme
LNCFERKDFFRIKVSMKPNRLFLLLAAWLQLSLAAHADLISIFTNVAPAATTALPRRASIIFIQCEGLGYGDLSCYGQTKFQTPNLDQLAAGGIRFTNYFAATASWPAQAALMLGKNPTARMAGRQSADDDIPLAVNEITVAQILKNSGYHTGLIGEWDLGDENSSGAPWKKGFDEFAGYFDPNDAENFHAGYIFRHAPRAILTATNNQMKDFTGREMIYSNTGGQKGQYIPDLLAKAALNFVKNNQPDQFNHYRPFFLLLNYKIPNGKVEVPTDAPFSEEVWPQPEKNKAALISRMDGYVGQLREQLEKIGMTNNVVIFFSSASGPKKTFEIDPAFFRSNLSTNDLRMPMIVCWPGNVPAGRVSNLPWSAQDFAPTALQIAYAKPAASFTGISVLPVLLGQPGTNAPTLPDRLEY